MVRRVGQARRFNKTVRHNACHRGAGHVAEGCGFVQASRLSVLSVLIDFDAIFGPIFDARSTVHLLRLHLPSIASPWSPTGPCLGPAQCAERLSKVYMYICMNAHIYIYIYIYIYSDRREHALSDVLDVGGFVASATPRYDCYTVFVPICANDDLDLRKAFEKRQRHRRRPHEQ